MTNKDIKWPNTTENFIQHIEQENNQKIIFSGRFGIEKTTFLRDFLALSKKNIL
jgi:stage III sporulation protein SpoIIIAA